MADIKCKQCGANLITDENRSVVDCHNCGSRQQVSEPDRIYTASEAVQEPAEEVKMDPLLRRAFLFLEDGDWDRAEAYCERILDQNPECAEAYLGKLMAKLQVHNREDLRNSKEPLEHQSDYRRAIRFGNPQLKAVLNSYNAEIQEKYEKTRSLEIYRSAVSTMEQAETEEALHKAAAQFGKISGVRDADVLKKQCQEKLAAIQAEKARLEEEKKQAEAKRREQEIQRKTERYNHAMEKLHSANTEEACRKAEEVFVSLPGFRDADALAQQCREKITRIREEEKRKAAAARKRGKTVALVAGVAAICAVVLLTVPRMIPKKEAEIPALRDQLDILLQEEHPDNQEPQYQEPDSPEEQQYKAAEALAAEGKHAHAGLAFAKLGTYRDARERSFEQWGYARRPKTIAYGTNYRISYPLEQFWIGLKNDGTVVATGTDTFGQQDVDHWTDIVEVAAISCASIGLRADGTVVTAGEPNSKNSREILEEVQNWTGIVSIVTYIDNHGDSIFGLRKDGTVVYAGVISFDPSIIDQWTDVVDLCLEEHLLGLRMDGTVVAAAAKQSEKDYGQCQVASWENIISLDAASFRRSHTMGLQADGSVQFTGAIPTNGWKMSPYHGQVEGWTDIIDVCGPVGLHADGTVSVYPEDAMYPITGETSGLWKDAVKDWEGVVALRGGISTIYGLKADGTVLAAGTMGNGALNVSEWTDIQDLVAANYHIGIKSDGSLVVAEYVDSEMEKWTDIRVS